MSHSPKRLFFKKFLTQPSINASITPSSQALARLMVNDIDWENINTIVEFGPGTGVFTEHIIKHMRPGTRLILLEFDADYAALLKQLFADVVTVICTDVQKFNTLLQEHQIYPDLIISGLPYHPFQGSEGKPLLETIREQLQRGCIMRGFSYSPWKFVRIYESLSPKMIDYTLSCIPPAFVYEMKESD